MGFKARLVSILVILLSMTACGGAAYREEKIKDYKLFFSVSDQALMNDFERLVDQYNNAADLGFSPIELVYDQDDANSLATITKGLEQRQEKIGFGQWKTKTFEEPSVAQLDGSRPKRIISYSMELEFDYDYIKQRSGAAANSLEWKEVFTLFAHEVGHGLQMNHSQVLTDVMYPSIDGNVKYNYTSYFAKVRKFFQEQ
ncbi:MAG: matrixin family metalloprotease [Oligoflexales bacterium]